MSSEIKLDAVIHYSGMEPAFNSNGKTSLVDRGNGIDKVQDSFRSQEEWSISNSLTTAEHRAASDRWCIFCVFSSCSSNLFIHLLIFPSRRMMLLSVRNPFIIHLP